MSIPVSERRVTPSWAWYFVPVAVWATAAIIAFIAWRPVLHAFSEGVDPVQNHAQLTVGSSGVTVYSTVKNTPSCTLTDSGGKKIALDPFGANVNWTIRPSGGPTYFGLGSTTGDVPAGTYMLNCPRAGNTSLATGTRIDIGVVTQVVILGVVVPIVLGFIGLVIVIVLMVRRHTSRSAIKTARLAAGGYPAWPSGWQSPPTP